MHLVFKSCNLILTFSHFENFHCLDINIEYSKFNTPETNYLHSGKSIACKPLPGECVLLTNDLHDFDSRFDRSLLSLDSF